jgi:hypothetical protein
MSRRNSSAFLSSVSGCLMALAVVLGASAGAQAQTPTPGQFPPNAEIEYERSVIRFPVATCTADGLCAECRRLYNCGPPDPGETGAANLTPSTEKPRVEMVELTAYMKLVRDIPQRNALGYRQFEFLIEEWELFGYSELLGGWLSFTASDDVIQPNSLALALQKSSDYPALIVYSAIYDIYLDDVKIVSRRAGTAMGRGVVEIPPRNVTVAFTKPQEVRLGDSGTPTVEFCCGTCEDMQTITREEFEAGLAEARAVRMAKKSNSDPAARAALTGGTQPGAAPAAPVKAPGTDGQQ